MGRSLAACAIAFPAALGLGVPSAQAKNGDTHITGQGIVQTIDCNKSTLLVNGTANTVYALGSCWAVTMQGSSNVVVTDNIVDNSSCTDTTRPSSTRAASLSCGIAAVNWA